jgi:hypothetical protein
MAVRKWSFAEPKGGAAGICAAPLLASAFAIVSIKGSICALP